MSNRNILISGASVAGPALAYWLSRRGFAPTVVERAPALRGGGYAVDFRGAAHLNVLWKMGILDRIQASQTRLKSMAYVAESGRVTAPMPAEIFAGDVEILRGDLGQILYDATRNDTEYVFGDSITKLASSADGVEVTFENSAPRMFDLVIGADGLHSAVRRLAFDGSPVTDLGLYVSIFGTEPGPVPARTGHLCSVPGKTAGLFGMKGDRGIAQLFFAGPRIDFDHRDVAAQREIVAATFAGMGWHVPWLMEQMRFSGDFYFDSCSQVRLNSWSRGRVALIGDAACAAGPGGNGTGNAVVAAYVLAGELARGDHEAAFARYERIIRPYVAKGQKQAAGSAQFLAPSTAKKIAQRDRAMRMMSRLPVKGVMRYLSARTANSVRLPSYRG